MYKTTEKAASKHDQGKSNRIQTVETSMRLFKEIMSSEEFYELEPREVLEVHLDESKETFPKTKEGKSDYSFVGGIIGRFG